MSEDMKDESKPTPPEVKEDDSSKGEEKTAEKSSKDNDKNDVVKEVKKEDIESGKDESGKEESEEDDDDDDDDDEAMGLLDRPVEVTGCRARKKVERLEVSFSTPKDKEMEIVEGKGTKLGLCPRIEFQIQKYKTADLKPLHRILFNKPGAEKTVKRNIRKFSGFPFDKNSDEYKKKLAILNKFSTTVLKRFCLILDLDRGGTKDNLMDRILEFLLSPQESGKKVPVKKSKSSAGKKKQKKNKPKQSDDEPGSANDEVDESNDSENELDNKEKSDTELKKKTKNASKSSASKNKSKKSAVKSKKEEKKTPAKSAKRKRDDADDDSDDDSSNDDKPLAKKTKMPSDDEIKKMIKGILKDADLEEITMKKVIDQVSDAYPDFDLTDRKTFIKDTVKALLNV